MQRSTFLDSVFERTATRFLRRIHRVTHRMPVKLRAVEKQRVRSPARLRTPLPGLPRRLGLAARAGRRKRDSPHRRDRGADPGGARVGLVSRWAVAPHEASGQIVTRPFTKAGMKERWSAVYNRRDAGPRLILARFAELLRATPRTSSARARLA